jgi:GNAT superfamily N-acetyltransferase
MDYDVLEPDVSRNDLEEDMFYLDTGQDDRKIRSAYEIADRTPLESIKLADADRYVVGHAEEDVVGFASIREGFVQKRGISDVIEVYQLAVDPDHQGKGYGRKLFERAVEEAEQMAAKTGYDTIYLDVMNRTSDRYDELQDEMDMTGRARLLDHCIDNDIDPKELVEVNEPMRHLAESTGFKPLYTSLLEREYIRAV